MSKKRNIVDVENDNLINKRANTGEKKVEVLIDLTNYQPASNQRISDINMSERQMFFLSQYYKSSEHEKKNYKRKFPGPAGFSNMFNKQGTKQGKSTRGIRTQCKSNVNNKGQSKPLCRDTSLSALSLPENNYTWMEIKQYCHLSNSDQNGLLNKMNIKVIEERMRGWNSSHPRITIPFLAAIITEDSGTVSNVSEGKKCISLTLQDFTGSITALLDDYTNFHLCHLLVKGTSLIVTQCTVYKVHGKLTMTLSKDMVVCLAVNNENDNVKLWKDIPVGFGAKTLDHHVIIFEQSDFNQKKITHEVSVFKDTTSFVRRSSSSFIQNNSPRPNTDSARKAVEDTSAIKHACKNDREKFETFTDIDNKKAEEYQPNNVESKNVICGEFDDNSDSESFDNSLIELVDKCEEDYIAEKHNAEVNPKKSSNQKKEKSPDQTAGEIQNDDDECNLDDSLLEFVDECAKKVENTKSCSKFKTDISVHVNENISSNSICGEFQDDSDDDIFNASLVNFERMLNNEPKSSTGAGTSSRPSCGEFEESSDENEVNLSLIEALKKTENEKQASNVNIVQNDNERVVGEFDDESDEEIDALILTALDKHNL